MMAYDDNVKPTPAQRRVIEDAIEAAGIRYSVTTMISTVMGRAVTKTLARYENEQGVFIMKCPECKIRGVQIGQYSYACPKCGKKIEAVKLPPKKDKKK